jgi:hypothetical protein
VKEDTKKRKEGRKEGRGRKGEVRGSKEDKRVATNIRKERSSKERNRKKGEEELQLTGRRKRGLSYLRIVVCSSRFCG